MKIIYDNDFDSYWKNETKQAEDKKTEKTVKKIITEVRAKGDAAVRKFASKFDKSSPERLEVSLIEVKRAYDELRASDPALTEALEFAANNIFRFSQKQKEQFADFEYEMDTGLITGQRVIPVERAAIYVPGGRFPLFSSVLMCVIPAFCAGADEVLFSSPPAANGLPDIKILAAAAIAAKAAGITIAGNENAHNNRFKVFAVGGAQAIAAFAFGTESIPRADVIAGPGNKYVAAAKRLLYGQVGIDFIAGPSDVLVITDNTSIQSADIIAADMIAQAEHDPDARARAIVPDKEFADKIITAIEKRLTTLPTAKTAGASLENGLIIVCNNREESIRIANKIAPEHLELQTADADTWIPQLKNYGSLFTGSLSAEVLGDYSAGINHTLPTSGSARFTGGLAVRHFLKTVTTLRCAQGEGFEKARNAAEVLARAEGLEGHAQSAVLRENK
ncbi:MAG: histidinol dehydrogenase [Treponema sp.]|jgi:histidinol dehydrogenase|nr:histidinol dehydrogenase [Treponema sp.]